DRAIDWEKYSLAREQWERADCPEAIAKHYLARTNEWKLPRLKGIITAPIVRPDGSILTKPGYDEATGLLLYSNIEWSVPTDLSQAAAVAAADELYRPFVQFSLSNASACSVIVSAILTGIQRRLLPTAPLHAFDANQWGSGKTLLAHCVSIIVTGAEAAVVTATA